MYVLVLFVKLVSIIIDCDLWRYLHTKKITMEKYVYGLDSYYTGNCPGVLLSGGVLQIRRATCGRTIYLLIWQQLREIYYTDILFTFRF